MIARRYRAEPALLALVLALSAACARAERPATISPRPTEPIEHFWVEPKDLATRDLFYGPGGRASVPKDVVYRLLDYDERGYSEGYDVEDPEGREWDVKTGDEAQPEIVCSRILWAIGYHQPIVHYVATWKMTGGREKDRPEPGRFRLEEDHHVRGEWSWKSNPFAGTRPHRGLIVANLLLNNWDLRPSQNRVFEMRGRSESPARRYVVLDLGGSLGRTAWPIGNRNNVVSFESQDFVKAKGDGRLKFDYHARHRKLLENLGPEDVVWTCRLLSRLSDRQWHDAFRAAAYSDEVTERYLSKIRGKIQEGLALERRGEDRG